MVTDLPRHDQMSDRPFSEESAEYQRGYLAARADAERDRDEDAFLDLIFGKRDIGELSHAQIRRLTERGAKLEMFTSATIKEP